MNTIKFIFIQFLLLILLLTIFLTSGILNAYDVPLYIQSHFKEAEYISLIVKGDINNQYFRNQGCKLGAKNGDFTTILVPVNNLEQLLSSPDFTIYPAIPDEPLLDRSTSDYKNGTIFAGCNADAAQSAGYDGTGVIVGILDYYPLNWKHVGFSTTGWNSDDLRVLYIWNQQDDSGTHPAGFDFGSEYSKADLMADEGPETLGSYHGTLCAGVAAGDGSRTDGGDPQMGIAPGADIIYVHKIWDSAGTINALTYFQNKANQLNRPIVISFSGGTKYGFPDGSDPVSVALNNFCTNGKLAAVAAGNYYTTTDHAYSTTTLNNPTTDLSFVIDSYTDSGSSELDDFIDIVIFFKSADNFDVTVTDPGSNEYETTISDDDEEFLTAYGKLYINHNSDSSIEVIISDDYGSVSVGDSWNIALEVPSSTYDDQGGKWSAWVYEENITGRFTNYNTTNYTLNLYATGEDCICVAAHSKDNGVLYSGSSKGLTIDNRQKPDISAPTGAVTTNNNSSNTGYSTLGATSGATPHVGGSLALMLQRYPNLTPAAAKQILTDNAYTDSQTAAYGTEPNSRFGYGKLNIFGSVMDSALPVTLSSFTAIFSNGSSLLQWTTQSESNNLGWNIYRSETGNYENEAIQITELIEGAGTTSDPTDYSFTDTYPIIFGDTYWYWIESISFAGESEIFGPVSILIPMEDNEPDAPEITDAIGLFQNYPNPFNPYTIISFSLEQAGNCEIVIYNIIGKKIKTLFCSSVEANKIFNLTWNGHDDDNKEVASGIYLYQLRLHPDSSGKTGNYISTNIFTKKMILLK